MIRWTEKSLIIRNKAMQWMVLSSIVFFFIGSGLALINMPNEFKNSVIPRIDKSVATNKNFIIDYSKNFVRRDELMMSSFKGIKGKK